jgi:DNA-binding NtrC family response regulator
MADPARRIVPTQGDDIVAAELRRAAAELNAAGWPTDVHQLREAVDAFVAPSPRPPEEWTREEWAELQADLDDLAAEDPDVAAAAKAVDDLVVRISGEVREALAAATEAELVEHHAAAMEGRRYGAAAAIEDEQHRRHTVRFPREQWTTPGPGQRPEKRRHP